jgi:hypothetical protein
MDTALTEINKRLFVDTLAPFFSPAVLTAKISIRANIVIAI